MSPPVHTVPQSASGDPSATVGNLVSAAVARPVHREVPAPPAQPAAKRDGVPHDIFVDAHGQPRRLRGVCVYSNSTRLAELAARIGFETIWIEMEHGPADFNEVEALCMAIETGGGIAAVRVPDSQRHHILRALEVGARIVIVPMVNTPEQARQMVEFGKFPPLGSRGFNVRSRGVNYGLTNDRQQLFADANQRTHLFAQIESMQAVQNLDQICAVEGLSGIFIGPGDLSVSLGIAGKLDGERMIQIVTDCVRRARAAGKHVGILVPPGALLDAVIAAGCDLMYYGGDVTELCMAWPKLLERVPATAPGHSVQS
jgi:4-hydroxy-2-oxoheptanedioate aldolase